LPPLDEPPPPPRVVVAARGDHQRERRAEHDERESGFLSMPASSSWGLLPLARAPQLVEVHGDDQDGSDSDLLPERLTPMITKPFWSTAGMKTPKTVPRIVPMPPNRLVPPMTTAAIALRLSSRARRSSSCRSGRGS
jgi:hypothetical protein